MLDVGLPDFITSSVWVAHIVSEMNSFITNSTFSHDCTSLINIKPTKHLQTHNKAILADIVAFCKHNFWKIMFFSHRTSLLLRKHSSGHSQSIPAALLLAHERSRFAICVQIYFPQQNRLYAASSRPRISMILQKRSWINSPASIPIAIQKMV